MDVGIGIYSDIEAESKVRLIVKAESCLKNYFKDRDYGPDIKNITIGFICERDQPGFEKFSEKRKPQYSSRRKVETIMGEPVEDIHNHFSYSVKFDEASYELFVQSSDIQSLSLIAAELIEGLSNFDKLPKKVKNFDVAKFKADMVELLNGLASS
ncbi:hypothetical protein [Pelagibius sp. Alg239-R121]|uniref:hypothetical protein n=1 Tax=Pelagibius sp. Alg239-R121 TaxID=2993448 RepID=UPI0024A69F08|nr:hypothetical protein [Pelagibius sp. Alg239-R121]